MYGFAWKRSLCPVIDKSSNTQIALCVQWLPLPTDVCNNRASTTCCRPKHYCSLHINVLLILVKRHDITYRSRSSIRFWMLIRVLMGNGSDMISPPGHGDAGIRPPSRDSFKSKGYKIPNGTGMQNLCRKNEKID